MNTRLSPWNTAGAPGEGLGDGGDDVAGRDVPAVRDGDVPDATHLLEVLHMRRHHRSTAGPAVGGSEFEGRESRGGGSGTPLHWEGGKHGRGDKG